MSFNILWPAARWPEPRDIERASVEPDGAAVFSETFDDVTDEQWATADGVVVYRDVPAEFRPKLERCRIVVKSAVGYDNIDIEGWGAMGVPVCNKPDYGTQEVADHALGLMMSLVRCIPMHHRLLLEDPTGNWNPPNNPYARRMSASTIGIVGLGRIGTAFALRAKALGADVVFYDPYRPAGADLALGIGRVRTIEELFAQSDLVSLHVPLTDETLNLINADVLSHAKQDLILINTARGPVIDIDALHDVMKSGQIRAAGLDVLPDEPPNMERPLIKAWALRDEWLQDRLVITPHSAFSTPESVYDMRFGGGDIALRYLREGILDNCINEHYLTTRR